LTSRPSLDLPSIAVVVTAYNYGHFLTACLQSVLDQTHAPDEIVVIDDGSTDNTPEVLSAYTDKVRVLRFENGGQAAGFNRGHEETTSDLVLYLDADDVLMPHAVETILAHWSSDMAHLVFDLEMIDETGASLGLHPGLQRAPLADNRPDLLRTGGFAFPPTSGNVFARALLSAAMPIPTARWRISADCYLVRAAALFGRTGYVPRALGGYRMHSANNYARLAPGEADKGLHLANRADVADAFDDLANASADLLGPSEDLVRKALRRRAGAIRQWDDDHLSRPFDAFAPLLVSRFLPILQANTDYDLTQRSELQGGCVTTADETALTLRLPVMVGPGSIKLEVDCPEDATSVITIDGARAAIMEPGATQAILSIDKSPFEGDRHIRIAATTQSDTAVRFKNVRLEDGKATQHAPFIPDHPPRLAYSTLAKGLDHGSWRCDSDGALVLDGQDGALTFQSPKGARALLSLGFGTEPTEGWLSINDNDNARSVFRGQTGKAARLDLLLDGATGPETTLAFDFIPDDGESELRVETVALTELRTGGSRTPPLSVGEMVTFASYPFAQDMLTYGWSLDPAAPPQMAQMEAGIFFQLPRNARDVTVTVAVSGLLLLSEEQTAIIGISYMGEMLGSAPLLEDTSLTVPLQDIPANGVVGLTLHSVFATETGPQLAPVEVLSLQVDGRLPAQPRPRPLDLGYPPDLHRLLAQGTELLTAEATPDRTDRLLEIRRALCRLIAGSDAALSLLVVGNEARLAALVDLSEAMRPQNADPEEVALLQASAADPSERGRLVHALLSLVLCPAYRHPFGGDISQLPPAICASPDALGTYLGAPPDLPDAASHAAYRSYLTRLFDTAWTSIAPGPTLGRRYAVAAATIRALRATRTIFADGNIRDLVRAQSRLIERLLLDEGATLSMPRLTRPGVDRLRIGVLVRDVTPSPEGWALQGMYAGLDQTRFEPILIRMGEDGAPAPSCFAETICLSNRHWSDAVREIRALDLDIFVVGAYARDFEPVSAIYAHRLAPLQLWHAAVCPSTGGFASFDAVISCQASEPNDAQTQYLEPLEWISGPKQCAYAFEPQPPADTARIRAELGVDPGQVILVSTAMAHKVSDALLAAWAQILQAAPDAVLVLAPFAPNWSMPIDAAGFGARVIRAGVPQTQVTILPALPPDRLHAVVAAADIMLDTFPYSGATTVCEALSQGTPVIAKAGSALRQLTGASWVRAYGLDALVAESAASYVALATQMATDAKMRADMTDKVVAAAAQTPPPHDDRAGFGAAYSDTLWAIAKGSGLFPGLQPAVAPPAFLPSHTPLTSPLIGRAMRPRMLAILASPRTGSTLICAVLNRTPGVLSHFELFHAEMIQYARSTDTDPDALAARNADPIGFLTRERETAARDGVQLLAFKHFAHLGKSVTDHIIDDQDTLLLHLSRENLLAQFSSEQIAMQSGKWVQHSDRSGEQFKVPFEEEAFKSFLQYQRRIEVERVNAIARASRAPLFVEYATLNTPETRKKISEFIGIDIPDSAQPDVKKQNRSDILSRFDNPDQVEAFLAERNLAHWAQEG
jgi:LPS sulfotransferase NodH/glycosyltransferase involved in cell wall biosynthesis